MTVGFSTAFAQLQPLVVTGCVGQRRYGHWRLVALCASRCRPHQVAAMAWSAGHGTHTLTAGTCFCWHLYHLGSRLVVLHEDHMR